MKANSCLLGEGNEYEGKREEEEEDNKFSVVCDDERKMIIGREECNN